jgi:VCBS repeat-containing protein
VAAFVLLVGVLPASANTTPQSLPFTQNWSNTELITTNDDWSGVPGIVGFLGQDITTAVGADPQTLLGESTLANDVDVIANLASPSTTAGGVGEFPTSGVVALQGSGTADAPYLLLTLNTTGQANVHVAYNLRDIDFTTDDAVQPVALQYRVGASGTFTNLPAGFVADATSGPSLDTLVTPVSVTLPAAADNQPLVQVRVITANAGGSDEWVGVDDIAVTAGGDDAPAVQTTSPVHGANDVAADANLTVTFTEPVNVTGSWFTLGCGTSGTHTATVTGGPTTFTLDPNTDFAGGETCTLTVVAANVADQDDVDPPDTMIADKVVAFATAVASVPPSLVINEIDYDQPSTDTAEYLEIKNTGASDASLGGVAVQFINGNLGGAANYRTTPLPNVVLAAGDFFVVCANTANTPNCDLDITPETDLIQNGAPDALALTFGPTILDTVSYEGATGAPYTETAGAPADTAAQALEGISRCPDGRDSNDNSADFLLRSDTPGSANDCPGVDLAPSVFSTTPANGAVGVPLAANVSITFSEGVDVTGSWFAIDCATSGAHTAAVSGGATTFTLDPDADFAPNESCTVKVVAANVTDKDTADPPDAMAGDFEFSFQTADVLVCGDPATKIHEIQGTGAASQLAGSVRTVEGVVVGDYQAGGGFEGYYLQEEDADADDDATTSEGLFVFSTAPVDAGDVVRVRGTVTEFNGLTELSLVSATAVCSTGAAVTPTAVSLPVTSLDVHERTEGMLVTYAQTLTATEVFNLGRFGEVSLATGRLYNPTAVTTPGAAAIARLDQNNRSRIVLDDGNNNQNIDPTRYPQGGLSATNTLRVGDTLPGLTGVMDFRFGVYRIQPVGPVSFDHTNPRTAAPEPVGGNLKVASFNVLNFFNGNGTGQEGAAGGFPTARGATTLFELGRQKAKEVSALKAMNADVVGLMEIENDGGPQSALAELVAALNAEMGAGTYAYVDTGVIGTDQIKVALIYKTSAVTPVGSFETITSADDPRFIDTLNRPSLAQTFERTANGGRLTVVVQHLKSKGSDCNAVGDPDTGDGSGNCNITRTNAAKALVDWLATDPTGSGDPDDLLIGDFNSYTFEQPIEWFVTHGYTNLIRHFGGLTPYSYVFNGESGYLDHGLASASLAAQATGAVDWHINPDEPTVLDYNTEFKTANQVNTFYDPGPYRASDHDPVVIGLDLNGPPTATGDSYSTPEDTQLSVPAPGVLGNDSDPDGDALTAQLVTNPSHGTLTLNANGSFTYDPAANANGPDGFTYRAVDEHGAVSETVTVSIGVTAVNDAPTVVVVAGGACDPAPEGGTMSLQVADVESAAGSLTLSASSSNAGLVPADNVDFAGSGAGRSVTIAPVEGRSGTAVITITVSDGNRTGTTTITTKVGTNGDDTIAGTAGADLVLGGNGDDAVDGGGAVDLVCGGNGDDTLLGGADADTLEGGNGDDTLSGGGGNDTLRGEAGSDRLTGGMGADAFSGGSGSDTAVDFTPAEGDTTDGS